MLNKMKNPFAEVKEAAARLSEAQWGKAAQLAGGKRSAADCRCHWAAALAARRGPWEAQEHARMLELAEARGFQNVRSFSSNCSLFA